MINNRDFVRQLAKNLKVNQEKATKIVEAFQETTLELLDQDDKMKIGDFLVFNKKYVPERYYKLPNSDELKLKEAYYKVSVKLTDKYEKTI